MRIGRTLSLCALVGTALVPAAPAGAAPVNHLLNIGVGGATGTGDSLLDGLPCPTSTTPVEYWHMGYETDLAPGAFGPVDAGLRLHLDVHTDAPTSPAPNGWLQGTESTATLANPRGTVVLRLQDGGSCGHHSAAVQNATVTTSGTWTVGTATGAYAGATAPTPGTFSVTAGIAPGASNPWTLKLNGTITVASPSLSVSAVQTYWGSLGLDYLSGTVSVVYQLVNNGPGAAYGVKVTGLSSPTPGVSLADTLPRATWDLAPGASTQLTVKWHLGSVAPCPLALNCSFTTTVNTAAADALDGPVAFTTNVPAVSPSLPI